MDESVSAEAVVALGGVTRPDHTLALCSLLAARESSRPARTVFIEAVGCMQDVVQYKRTGSTATKNTFIFFSGWAFPLHYGLVKY